MHHMNAGHTRFCGVKKPNVDRIAKEIEEEGLTAVGHSAMIEIFF